MANRKETVAGIDGEVYEFHLRNNKGEERVEEAVLSGDKRAREFTAALFKMTQIAAVMAGEEAAGHADDLHEMLNAMEVGILRVGKDLMVQELTDDEVPAERFALPAEPMDFGGLGNLFGGGQKSGDKSDSEDSGLGGALKKLFDND